METVRHATGRLLLTLLLVIAAVAAHAQTLTVGTYNMRNDNEGDARKGNGWQRRCPVICEQIEWIDFDIFGAQEIKKNQLDDLLAALPEYDYVGVGRDDGIHGGEHEPIFYKRDRSTRATSGSRRHPTSQDRRVGMPLCRAYARMPVCRTGRRNCVSGTSTSTWTT